MIKWKPSKQECNKFLEYKLAMVLTRDYERILIGTMKDILLRLEGIEGAELFYDKVRPFGTYLLHQETDAEWNTALTKLEKARTILDKPAIAHPFSESVIALERDVQYFLEGKCDSLDPITQFVATRIWYSHWKNRGLKNKAKSEEITNMSRNLVRPFSYPFTTCMQGIPLTPLNPIFKNCKRIDSIDGISITYTTNAEPSLECILVDNSLIPLERFYSSQIEKYTKYIIECKICKKPFIADTLRFELCSDECRAQAIEESKLQRMKDPTTSEIELLLSATRSFWNRRLNKIKRSPKCSAEKVQDYEKAMQTFRKDATSLHREHKQGTCTTKEFTDWLFMQQGKAESVYQELMVTKR